jgi:hypothetical protein
MSKDTYTYTTHSKVQKHISNLVAIFNKTELVSAAEQKRKTIHK